MASHPPGPCCTVGTLYEGEPQGESIKIGNGKIDAYLAKPPADKALTGCGIIFLPDVIGIWQNSKLLADNFAAAGYPTLLVDLFDGDPVPLNRPASYDLMKWLRQGSDGKTPHTKEAVDPITLAGIAALREMGVAHIAAVGYCFGAKYAIRHYKSGIECAFVAHPSFVDDEELAALSGPLSIAAAEEDFIFSTEKRHQSEEILKKTGQPYQVNLYSGVVHGFAVRGKIEVQVERFAKEQAFRQALIWLQEFLPREG
ncbi:hypothetical protein CDD81_1632 [Ophiocordyceps australis]|uniref:Dienelactone hydrolase domain-containing protein n=1 Tax=Ophiocordyceps australis TaxID=1399860 RepID=A0A2C5XVI0_9HYPO|nr:hypothetical protein CDD81_1632 [Ophiocordyceps australis]